MIEATGSSKNTRPRIINVTADNVDESGFFCYMSKKSSEGYQRKLAWLKARFAEGMKLKMVTEGGRGFIEYLPGHHAWRPVTADQYMFIHCIWITGQSKGKGLSQTLLKQAVRDAKAQGLAGVAMVTSQGNWLVGREFLEKHGFSSVDQAPPSFQLMVKKFRDIPSPRFTGQWDEKMRRYGKGVTIVRTDQCPYIDRSIEAVQTATREEGIKTRIIELKTAKEVREQAPSAYGVYGVVYDRRLLSYHPIGRENFLERLNLMRQNPEYSPRDGLPENR